MQIDFSEQIEELKLLQKKFNEADDTTTAYACIMAIKDVAKKIPIDEYWEETYKSGMIHDVKVKA